MFQYHVGIYTYVVLEHCGLRRPNRMLKKTEVNTPPAGRRGHNRRRVMRRRILYTGCDAQDYPRGVSGHRSEDTPDLAGHAEEDVAGRKSEACAGRKRIHVGSVPGRSKASVPERE